MKKIVLGIILVGLFGYCNAYTEDEIKDIARRAKTLFAEKNFPAKRTYEDNAAKFILMRKLSLTKDEDKLLFMKYLEGENVQNGTLFEWIKKDKEAASRLDRDKKIKIQEALDKFIVTLNLFSKQPIQQPQQPPLTSQKWSGTKKVVVVGGTTILIGSAIGLVYWLYKRNQEKKKKKEKELKGNAYEAAV